MSVAPTPAPDTAKPKRVYRLDQSAGIGRILAIVIPYTAVMVYALNRVPTTGMRYHNDVAWMRSLITWPMIYVAPLLYVVAVIAGCRYMQDKKSMRPFLKAYVQPIYNVVQILVCGYMVAGFMYRIDILGGNPFSLNVPFDAATEWFCFVHYLTKFLDWSDTLFMILSKSYKQVSFLQVYHHATIGMVWGALLSKGFCNGTAFYGAFINSLTHVIMYSHYLWTSLGFTNPFKEYITTFQIAQFASCILSAICGIAYDKIIPWRFGLIQVVYHYTMLLLFGFNMSWVPSWLTGQPIASAGAEKKSE